MNDKMQQYSQSFQLGIVSERRDSASQTVRVERAESVSEIASRNAKE
jgi:hypothetical protein